MATRDPHIVRLQVKRALEPQKDKERFNRRSWKWAVGIGRRKDILIPTDHYDVLALVPLEPNVIQLVNAKDVNKKTFRTKRWSSLGYIEIALLNVPSPYIRLVTKS